MNNDHFRELIEHGDVSNLRQALESDPTLANQPISWFLNQQNESDPLHYVSDCVGHGWLANGTEGEIAGHPALLGGPWVRPEGSQREERSSRRGPCADRSRRASGHYE
jgi:hypothetical protein